MLTWEWHWTDNSPYLLGDVKEFLNNIITVSEASHTGESRKSNIKDGFTFDQEHR
jgi:hypothetical protein